MATVSEKVRNLRTSKGLSQTEVALQMKMSRPTYLMVEAGKRQPTIPELEALAGIFGTSLHDLLFNNEIIGHAEYRDSSLGKYKQMVLNCLQWGADVSDKKITKTKLAKLVYFADFTWFFYHRASMSGLQYRRIQQGPVPDQYFRAIDELFGSGTISIEARGTALMIKSYDETAPSNKLSTEELDLIKKVSLEWKGKNTQDVVDFTHNQIPWRLCKQGELIPYELILNEKESNLYSSSS